MKEYISRDAALEMRVSEGYNNDGILLIPLRDVSKHLLSIPAADVAPVVRCINCRHGWAFFDASMPGGPYVLCGKPYAAPRETHKFDYFCADGKPKEDTP